MTWAFNISFVCLSISRLSWSSGNSESTYLEQRRSDLYSYLRIWISLPFQNGGGFVGLFSQLRLKALTNSYDVWILYTFLFWLRNFVCGCVWVWLSDEYSHTPLPMKIGINVLGATYDLFFSRFKMTVVLWFLYAVTGVGWGLLVFGIPHFGYSITKFWLNNILICYVDFICNVQFNY